MSDASYAGDDDQYDTEAAPLGEDEYEDDPSGLNPPEPELTVEERAAAQGWRPGRPGKSGVTLTAQEFLDRGVEEHSILRHNNEKLTDRLARLERKDREKDEIIAQQARAIKDGITLAQRASDAGYQRALNELRSQQREAAATGDVAVYDQTQQQIDAMETQRAKNPAPTLPEPPAPAPNGVTDPVIRDFLSAPPAWFQNPEMRAALITAQSNLVKANPGVAEGDLLDEAIEEVAAIFPGRIRNRGAPPVPPRERQSENPAPARPAPARRPAAVLSPGAGGVGRPPAPRDPFTRLPETDRAEARQAFQTQAPWGESDAAKYVALRLGERSAADVAADTRAKRIAARK